MITENQYVAQQVGRHIDLMIEKLKKKLANPQPSDTYTDQVRLWSTVGQIKGLKNLKNELIKDDE